jgi:AcrR family transcriptional regulator
MPRDTLTLEQIVTAAVGLLDDEGLEGLNMRALGNRLDSAATAVYWHVGGKDDLVRLAADSAWQEVELPDPGEIGWRAAAEQMAVGLHAMLTRHPWLVQAFGAYQLYGPGKARHDDHALGVYEAAGFDELRAEQALTSVFTFVLGNALGPAATASFMRKLSRADGDTGELVRAYRAEVTVIAKEFPRLRARIESPAAEYGTAPDDSFAFGLQALLDGLENNAARISGQANSEKPHQKMISPIEETE